MTVTMRVLYCLLLVTALSCLSGCASFYVDGNVPEVPTSQYKKPATPADVQLAWEFQTKGVTNAQATQFLKARVRNQIFESGLFKNVSDTPVASGAVLFVTVNNVVLSDDAFSKGFTAGMTFGVAGQTVGDGYECTLRYLSGRKDARPLIHSNRHIIYTHVGAGGSPPGAQKMTNADEAISTVLRQSLSHALDALSQDPAFP